MPRKIEETKEIKKENIEKAVKKTGRKEDPDHGSHSSGCRSYGKCR